jgi:uncharacterized protein
LSAVELNLDRLERGRSVLSFDTELACESSEGAEMGAKVAVVGELAVDDMDQRILVHGSFQSRQSAECDRCNREFELEIPAELELMILRNPSRGDELEDAEDAWIIHQQRGVVPLDGALLEAVNLAEPQKLLCREDCKGLCPSCGVDWNETSCECTHDEVDSRWAALEKLKEENPD